MGFHEVNLADVVKYGVRIGPGWENRIIELPDSGADEVVQLNNSPRWKFEIAYAIRQATEIAAIRAFYLARGGSANGFRFKDWSDYASTSSGTTLSQTVNHQDIVIGVGDGVTTQFQLIKRYTSGSQTYTRTIRKPVSGTVVVALDTTQKTLGTDFTVDTTTGIVLFTVAPTLGQQVKAGFQFDVPVRFGGDADELFATTIEAFDQHSVESIQVVELRNPTGDPEDVPMRGGQNLGSISANFFIAQGNGFVQRWSPAVGSLKGFLPDATDLEEGGPYFHLWNTGSFSFDVRSATDAAVGTIGTSASAFVSLVKDPSGTKAWLLT